MQKVRERKLCVFIEPWSCNRTKSSKSWRPVLGSGNSTGLPFLLLGIMANTLASDIDFTGLMKKIIICWEGSERPTSEPLGQGNLLASALKEVDGIQMLPFCLNCSSGSSTSHTHTHQKTPEPVAILNSLFLWLHWSFFKMLIEFTGQFN